MNRALAFPEKLRRQSNTERAEQLLRQQRQATNLELAEVAGMRYGARVQELRERGYVIDSEQVKGGLWLFLLRRCPEDDPQGVLFHG